MNIIKYQAFIKVTELGSMTKAADALGYSQPGISHMIDSLEKELGFKLLIRNKDYIKPTENGEKILYYCYQIIKNQNGLSETIASINGLLSGEIKIGALNSMLVDFVPKAVCRFKETHPEINIKLHEYTYTDIQTHLHRGSIDIGFMNDQSPKGFEFYPLFDDPICVIMPIGHQFMSYNKIPIQFFNDCDFIMPLNGWDDIYTTAAKQEMFYPAAKHYTASDTAAISMVESGMGLYLLSKLQTKLLPDTVTFRELDGDFSRTLGMCIKSFKHASPASKAFIRYIQKYASGYNRHP